MLFHSHRRPLQQVETSRQPITDLLSNMDVFENSQMNLLSLSSIIAWVGAGWYELIIKIVNFPVTNMTLSSSISLNTPVARRDRICILGYNMCGIRFRVPCLLVSSVCGIRFMFHACWRLVCVAYIIFVFHACWWPALLGFTELCDLFFHDYLEMSWYDDRC